MPPAKKTTRTTRKRTTKKAITITGVDVLDGGRYVVHWTGAGKNEHADLLTIPFLEETVKDSAPAVAAHYQTLLDAINSHEEEK
ncbi:MAG: hypothetical protein OXI23_09710 [Gemmatimonadota bacterium]|nr:hypothetical protein [Gemmatimonadota bacterium]